MMDIRSVFTSLVEEDGNRIGDTMDIALDYMIRGLILFLPIAFLRDNFLNGFTEQDIYFCMLVLLISLHVVILAVKRTVSHATSPDAGIDRENLILTTGVLICQIALVVGLLHPAGQISRLARYAVAFILILSLKGLGRISVFYLKLFTFPFFIIDFCLYFYVFTGLELLPDTGLLISSSDELAPLLMLGCVTVSILYMMSDSRFWRGVYIVLDISGSVLLFLLADMPAFCIVLFFLLLIPNCFEYTYGRLKDMLTLIFIYAFSASNAALIPYFGALGLDPNRTYDLRYSIYIDILIAIAGLLISRYMDRFGENADRRIVIPEIDRIFRFARYIMAGVMFILVLFSDPIASLPDSEGLDAIKALADGLSTSVAAGRGEWWYIIRQDGVFATLVWAGLVIWFAICLYRRYKISMVTDVPWFLIGTLFLVQSFFYPLSVVSCPVYILYMGFALAGRNKAFITADVDTVETAKEADTTAFDIDGEDEDEDDDSEELEFISLDEADDVQIVRKRDGFIRAANEYLRVAFGGGCMALLAILTITVISRWFVMPLGVSADLTLTAQARVMNENSGSDVNIENGMIIWETVSDDLAKRYPSHDKALAPDETGAASDDDGVVDVGTLNGDEDIGIAPDMLSISNGDYTIYDPNAYYEECNDIVTALDRSTRLRSEPSIGDEGEIVHILTAGEKVVRDGIGNNGWSRVKYGGRTCYAVTEYLAVLGTYHGNPGELMSDRQEEEQMVQQDTEVSAERADNNPDKPAEQAPAVTESQKAKSGPGSYSIQWSNDNKVCSIWSSGVRQGTMSVMDGDNAQKINVYSDYYTGSGKNSRRYLSISVPAGENPYSLKADSGFVSALKSMGYSGVYFNKQIIDW